MSLTASWDVGRHEVSRLGRSALLAPPAIVLAGGALVVSTAARSGSPIARLAAGVVEMGVPLAVGIVAAGLVSTDPLLELQLSLPTAFRVTLARRVGLLLAWAGGLAVVGTTALILAGGWPGRRIDAQTQLVWLAPMMLLAGLGLAAAALMGRGIVGTATVGALWILQVVTPTVFVAHRSGRLLYLFANGRVPGAPYTAHGRLTSVWAQDRVVLLAVGLGLAAVAWVALRSPERLLRGAQST